MPVPCAGCPRPTLIPGFAALGLVAQRSLMRDRKVAPGIAALEAERVRGHTLAARFRSVTTR